MDQVLAVLCGTAGVAMFVVAAWKRKPRFAVGGVVDLLLGVALWIDRTTLLLPVLLGSSAWSSLYDARRSRRDEQARRDVADVFR